MKTKILKICEKEFDLKKISSIRLEHLKGKEFIHFDKMKDGSWRMVYTETTIPDLKAFSKIEIKKG